MKKVWNKPEVVDLSIKMTQLGVDPKVKWDHVYTDENCNNYYSYS